MSDSDDDVSHVFDQTNGVIAASGGEADGALSGRTSADVEDPTGSTVARTAPPADRQDDVLDDAADRDADAGTAAAAAVPTAVDTAAVDRDDDRSEARTDSSATARTEPVEDRVPAADGGEEHTYAVDSRGTATDEGTTADDDAYSGAPAVAALSAADDGRDEGSTRAESSTHAVDDASHTGRLADAYATGPAEEVGAGRGDRSYDRDAGATAAVAADGGTRTGADATEARDDSDRLPPTQPTEQTPPSVQSEQVEQPERQAERPGGLGDLAGDDSIGHVFDQTNGVIEGADGESDGTADSDTASSAERSGL